MIPPVYWGYSATTTPTAAQIQALAFSKRHGLYFDSYDFPGPAGGQYAVLAFPLATEAAVMFYERNIFGEFSQSTITLTVDGAPVQYSVFVSTVTRSEIGDVTVVARKNYSPSILQFSAATYSVNENGGTAVITVTRGGGTGGTAGVTYATSNGTATAGSDYTAASGTLSWASGDSASKTFTVTVIDDLDSEGDKTVNLTLSAPTGGATLGAQSTAVLTILENEISASLLHFDGADGSTTFTDEKGAIWTSVNGAQIDTAQSKFGGASGLFIAASRSYISTPYAAALDLSTGDWTIEFFLRRPVIDEAQHVVVARKSTQQKGFQIVASSAGGIGFEGGDSTHGWEVNFNTSNTVAVDTWAHAAVCREGSTIRSFLGGIGTASPDAFAGVFDADTDISIGAIIHSPASSPFNGWVDEFRITKGVARYTANFTPPTAAFLNF